ncbi:MAG TPA: glycoside hydrolase family 75 protein, partial [Polyangiaceae bacterium]|nr:glycoside hydrolase family 75 protein [Polyangiaceae bacterium]
GTNGVPTAAGLLAKVAACTGTPIKTGFGLDGQGSLSMYQCGSAVYWKADMDVDCDGIQTPPCDTDPQGQPQTSIVDAAPNGDVDPTLLPYFVIPLGKPETAWYTAYGIELGQVGAVIYQGQVRYGIFADEAGGWFIGESSYAMCQLFLGPPNGANDPCSPIDGGIDPADVAYVTFTGANARATGTDIYDHATHESLGEAAARAWLAGP